MEKSLTGQEKVYTLIPAAIGWIFFITLATTALREDPLLTTAAVVSALVFGTIINYKIASPTFLQSTGKHRKIIMAGCIAVFFAGYAGALYAFISMQRFLI